MTWGRAPVRRLFRIINGGTPTAEEANWGGEVAWATPIDLASVNGGVITTTQRKLTATGLRTGSRAVKGASLVLSTRAPVGYIAQTVDVMAFNQGCRGLEPAVPLDVRYFRYQLSTMTEHVVAAAQGSTFVELSTEAVASLPVLVPPLPEQRAIADFLEGEIVRIDDVLGKRLQMLSLLLERRNALVEEAIRGINQRTGAMPLRHAVRRVEVGIVVRPASWYCDDGIIALRGINIRPGSITLDDIVRISTEGHTLHSQSILHAGDLVMVRTGQAGAAAVVAKELEGANCIDLVIIRPGPGLLAHYLELVLNSDWTQKHIEAHSVGTIQAHFNVGAMKQLPLPVPSLAEQHRIAAELDEETAEIDAAASRIRQQAALLRERRQALITAAVTGEIDVTKGAA